MWWGTFDVECSRERLREIWWITVTWNAPENGGVEYDGERWCGMWWGTEMWNAPENGDAKYGGEL